MSSTVEQPRLDAGDLDTQEVEVRLAWPASAGTEDEALVIEVDGVVGPQTWKALWSS